MGLISSKMSKSCIPSDMAVSTIATKPIEGQKPGTSGLRKKTKVFMGAPARSAKSWRVARAATVECQHGLWNV